MCDNLWIANKYISGEHTDGGKTRILTLKLSAQDFVMGMPGEVATNEDKSEVLARLMFPKKPQESSVPWLARYPNGFPTPGEIRADKLHHHITRLSPYKATGSDETPNVLINKCADLVTLCLLQIYRMILMLGIYVDTWRDVITCILRNPGKPRYDIPKSYQPIALLNTMVKLLTLIIAGELSYLMEKHQFLLPMHFRGRPG